MDYSLLLAIERILPDSKVTSSRHMYYSRCGKYVYHLAIIDYLQTFDMSKKFESGFKQHVLFRPMELISAVEPILYGQRFIKFMKNEVILDTIL